MDELNIFDYFLLIFRTAALMKNSHFGSASPPFSHFRGPQMPEQAHLVRGACLGSHPCLQEEPELMALKWRPDGDGGLIAAEGTSESCPLLLSRYFQLKLPVCSSFFFSYHQATVLPLNPSSNSTQSFYFILSFVCAGLSNSLS